MGSQDGCGNSFLEYLLRGDRSVYLWHTYWDDEGDVTWEHADEGAVFYDALPVVLRDKLEEGLTYKMRVIPSLVSNRLVKPDPVDCSVAVSRVKQGGDDAREVGDRFEVTLTCGGAEDVLLFDASFPHRLIQWVKANGDRLLLKKAHNIDYWNFKGTTDRHLQTLD